MNRYKVCVYAICKNEEDFVDLWMDSMEEADLVVVTDTGSTDETVARLQARGAIVHQQVVAPWRFDVARNISLSHVPDDVDICVCTDLDERFEPGWRAKLDQAWVEGTHTANYLYHWSLKPDGSPDIEFVYFKIHTKKDYTWRYPVHECLKYTAAAPERKIFVDGVVLKHYPDDTKSRSSYLPLLELAVREMPEDDRMAHYLGREYLFAGQWKNCIATLKQHLALERATWTQERCASMRWIAKAYHQLGDDRAAYRWHHRALGEDGSMREPYVEFALLANDLGDWPTCLCMARTALDIKEKSAIYINTGYAWDFTPYDLAALASFHLGLGNDAVEYGTKALSMAPEDGRLNTNLSFYTAALPTVPKAPAK